MNDAEHRHILKLIKRRDWLAARIVKHKDKPMTFDKAEHAALTWAIEFVTHALEAV